MIISFNFIPVASGYEEIRLYSGMSIDNVKINTSLIMMKEWLVNPHSPRTKRFLKDQEMFGRQSPSDISRADENLEVEGDVYFTTQHIPT